MIEWANVRVRLGDLKPWEQNPRHITKRQAERLAESFKDFGQVETIAIGPDGDGGCPVYNGHQRLSVLLKLRGTNHEIDARQSSRPLSDDERRKLVVFLHAGAVGGWSWDALSGWDSSSLMQWGFDADLLQSWRGDIAALGNLLESETVEPQDAEPQIDRAAELQEKWQVKTGEVFKVGEHIIICGDCREAETWGRLLGMAGVDKVNGVFTSPPYAEQRKEQYGGVPTDEYVEWWDAVQANVKANLAQDGSFFVNIKPHCEDGERVLYVFDLVLAMRRKWGWRFVDELCWNRAGLPGDQGERFRNNFEPVYHFSFAACKFRPANVMQPTQYKRSSTEGKSRTGSPLEKFNFTDDMARPSNVLCIPGASHEADRSEAQAAKFPVALPDFFIRAYSDEGDAWCDPFLGSGTTIVAAANNKRRGLGIEKLEKYVAVCLDRMATAFPDIEIERLAT